MPSEVVVQTIVGSAEAGFSGDGGPALSAQLNAPIEVAFDAWGSMYIADRENCRVRKVTNGRIESIAGGGIGGRDLYELNSVAIDPVGIGGQPANTLYMFNALEQLRSNRWPDNQTLQSLAATFRLTRQATVLSPTVSAFIGHRLTLRTITSLS